MSDHCRACKAPIVWAKTENGRPMPLDPHPDTAGNVTLVHIDDRLIAIIVERDVLEALRAGGDRRVFYRSHFASCPFANEFRREQ
jgi:DICT domain-containing protein